MWEDKTKTVSELGKLANDPYPMEDMPNISSLKVNFNLDSLNPENSTLIFLSKEALTDNKGNIISEFGYLKEHLANGILSFPMLTSGEDTFTFTYLHPGTYYITVVSDLNGDFFLSEGDKTHPSKIIHVASGKNEQVTIGL